MYITITGNLGSGKSTICGYLANKYGFSICSTGKMHRDIAARMGITTLELNELMRRDYSYDHVIDDEIVRVSNAGEGENILFDSRLAFHFVKKSFKVFVVIDPFEAARRVLRSSRGQVEAYASAGEAMAGLRERAMVENVRFKEMYGVDNLDYRNFNLVIDNTRVSVENAAESIYARACLWQSGGGEETLLALSPCSVYPTRDVGEGCAANLKAAAREGKSAPPPEPITVACLDGYNYVLEGHMRLLAAQLGKEDFVFARLGATENLGGKIKSAGMQAVRAMEREGGFTYLSYPGGYGQ